MNDLPSNWSAQIEAAYPRRAGPNGWRGMKLMLALRRALFESTFEEILDGCKRYKAFAQASGIDGTMYVQGPTRFIEDGSFLEEFVYAERVDPKIIESRNREADRWRRAREAAGKLSPPLEAYPNEYVGAFETRVRLQEARGANQSHMGRADATAQADIHGRDTNLASRISSLAERMKNGTR